MASDERFNAPKHIVKLPTLRAFLEDRPKPVVRICAFENPFTRKGHAGKNVFYVPWLRFGIHIQAISLDHELLWLTQMWETMAVSQETSHMDPQAWSVYKQLVPIERALGDYLAGQAFVIRTGVYGVPHTIEPMRGIIEVLRFTLTEPDAGVRSPLAFQIVPITQVYEEYEQRGGV